MESFASGHRAIWLGVFLFLNFSLALTHPQVNTDPYHHFEVLEEGRVYLEYRVDLESTRAYFNITAATKGWIGFGMARSRGNATAGEDLMIGGVLPNGKPYMRDMYALGDGFARTDPTRQDWAFHGAHENGTHTFMSFSTLFDTCDPDYDLVIDDDLITLIWDYGRSDDEGNKDTVRFRRRGEKDLYMLDADLTPDLERFRRLESAGANLNMKRFEMTSRLQLPNSDTMYWCHFFRAPTQSKRHIVGFQTVFPTARDRKHIHHLLVHRCRAPPGVNPDKFFGPASRSAGAECFFTGEPRNKLPTTNCQESINTWAVGGRAFFLPEKVGISMTDGGVEYFMVQAHYDNPELARHQVQFTVEAYYTDELRQYDAKILPLGQPIPAGASIVIPPNEKDHVILGHCPKECLQTMFPRQGVNAFAAFLHTHLVGRGVRIQHFRGDKELPWISTSDNYNFDYQQWRHLHEERRILPTDQLGVRCTYDVRSRNGAAAVGGHSTRDEMCTALLYYYSEGPTNYGFCRSALRTRKYLDTIRIGNTTWDPVRYQEVVSAPPKYAGNTIYEHVNRNLRWTEEFKDEVQKLQRFEPQIARCPIVDDTAPTPEEWEASEHIVWNPRVRGVKRYRKPPQCGVDRWDGNYHGGFANRGRWH